MEKQVADQLQYYHLNDISAFWVFQINLDWSSFLFFFPVNYFQLKERVTNQILFSITFVLDADLQYKSLQGTLFSKKQFSTNCLQLHVRTQKVQTFTLILENRQIFCKTKHKGLSHTVIIYTKLVHMERLSKQESLELSFEQYTRHDEETSPPQKK